MEEEIKQEETKQEETKQEKIVVKKKGGKHQISSQTQYFEDILLSDPVQGTTEESIWLRK